MPESLTKTKIENISWDTAQVYNEFVNQIANFNPELEKWVGSYPSPENLKLKCENRSQINRELLVTYFTGYYEKRNFLNEEKQALINSLAQENTFTVTSGHQICFLTGPLYFVVKIAQSIRLAELYHDWLPNCSFVPVYWMATEDHDYEEIRKAHFFNRDFLCAEDQSQKAVGELSKALISDDLRAELEDLLCKNDNGQAAWNIIDEAFRRAETLADFCFYITHSLFQGKPLLILDANAEEFKQSFKPVLEKELKEQVVYSTVEANNEDLKLKTIPIIKPRELNLFYFDEGKRQRLVKEGDGFRSADSDAKYSLNQLLEDCGNLSPNVLLRPIYQESILPNITYVGGAAELQYWAELPKTFEAFGVSMPFFVLRNSLMILSPNEEKKVDRLDLSVSDLFNSDKEIKEKVLENDGKQLHFGEAQQLLNPYIKAIENVVSDVDKSLLGSVRAHANDERKYLSALLKDLKKRELAKKEEQLTALFNMKEKLLPNGKLNERKVNVFEYLVKHGISVMDEIYEAVGAQTEGVKILRM